MQHSLLKLPCQKQMLKPMKRGVQNGLITKNGVLPETTVLFWKILFQFKNLLERVDLMYHIHTFIGAGILLEDAFFRGVYKENVSA